jgi:hypothetical protein
MALVIGLGCLPLGLVFLFQQWHRPAYRFFPLALLAGGWLLRRGWRSLTQELAAGSGLVAGALLGGALLVLAVSTLLWLPLGGAVAALLALWGLIWWRGGGPLLRALLPGLLLWLTLVPVPLAGESRLLTWLGRKLVGGASRLLYELDVSHFISADAVELPRLRLSLAEVCAPLNVLPGLLALSLFYMLWRRRSAGRTLLAMVAMAGFVVLAMAATVIAGVKISLAHQFDVFAGTRGGLLGLGMVLVCAVLLASFDQLLEVLLAPIAPTEEPGDPSLIREVTGPPLCPRGRATAWALGLAGAFALVGSAALPLGGLFYSHLRDMNRPPRANVVAQAVFSLPPTLGQWQQVAAPPVYVPDLKTNAAVVRTWYFESPELGAAVALEYPLRGCADPADQYALGGWTVWQRTVHPVELKGVPPALELDMQKDWFQVGTLWVGWLDGGGQWLVPAQAGPGLVERFKPKVAAPVLARLQVLGAGREDLSPEGKLRVAELFQAARGQLDQQYLSQLEKR